MLIRVVDFETTGTKPPPEGNDAVCEVGWCDVVETGSGWSVLAPLSFLCNPGRAMPAEARAVHHIGDAELAGAPPAADAVRALLHHDLDPVTRVKLCMPDFYAAHHAKFERGFIGATPWPWICSMQVAKHRWPENEAGFSNQTLRYWLGLRLDDQLATPPHRAGPDAYVTAHIVAHMLNQEGLTPEEMVALTDEPALLRRVSFGKHRGKLWEDVARDEPDYLRWVIRQPDFDPDVAHTARALLEGGR